jgi:uncharacterized ubiquitin-like protein YukD
MRITLSLQPGSKVALPLELPDEAVPSMTVRELKARIMAMNASKDAAMLHCIHRQKILEDDALVASYGIQDGDVVKYLFAEEKKGGAGAGTD